MRRQWSDGVRQASSAHDRHRNAAIDLSIRSPMQPPEWTALENRRPRVSESFCAIPCPGRSSRGYSGSHLIIRNRPVVVIPVHRARPSRFETVSLRQCGKILANRDIVILASKNVDLAAYQELLPRAVDLRVEPHWMASVQAYNKMMISPLVFNALDGFTHMILHEPDAIVIRDEIDYWCNQPFDYIGAPWFEGWSDPALRPYAHEVRPLSLSALVLGEQLVGCLGRLPGRVDERALFLDTPIFSG
jgi:hypothetical protein